ncbi:MAG: phage tail tape measure protein [Bacteroidota bacterium]
MYNFNVKYQVDKTGLTDSKVEVKAIAQALKVTEQEAARLSGAFDQVASRSKQMAGASKSQIGLLERLQQEEKELLALRQKSTDPRQIKQYNRLLEENKRKTQELTDTSKKGFGQFGGVLQKTTLLLGGLFAVDRILDFGKASVTTFANFQKSLSSLSSITGATGQDLEFFKEQAAEIGETTTLSAAEAVDAFRLIGSAKPELLRSKEALAEVTQEAVTLAEAAEIDLPTAAQSLAGALNQFQLPAEEASRVINALAAGSKEGAAAIPEVAASLDKFGVVAKGFNVSFEESVGLVELLAENNIKGAESGTALRNVLSRLQSAEALPKAALETLQQYGVNLEIVTDTTLPLNERLTEFSKIAGDATALTKVFGIENQVAGRIVLSNVDKFERYTEAVTGTNTAYEQQKINTDNLVGDQKALASAYESLQISLVEGLEPALRSSTQRSTEFIKTIRAPLTEFVGQISVLSGELFTGIGRFFEKYKGAFKVLFETSSIGMMVRLVRLLAKAFEENTIVAEGLRKVLGFLWEISPLKLFLDTLNAIYEAFTTIQEGIEDLVNADGLLDFAGKFWDLGKDAGKSFVEGMNKTVLTESEKSFLRGIGNISKQVNDIFADGFGAGVNKIANYTKDSFNNLKDSLPALKDASLAYLNDIKNGLLGVSEEANEELAAVGNIPSQELIAAQIKNANELKRRQLASIVERAEEELKADETSFTRKRALNEQIAMEQRRLNQLNQSEALTLLNMQADENTDYYGERALILQAYNEEERKLSEITKDRREEIEADFTTFLAEENKKRIEELKVGQDRELAQLEQTATRFSVAQFKAQNEALKAEYEQGLLSRRAYLEQSQELVEQYERGTAFLSYNLQKEGLQNDLAIIDEKLKLTEEGSNERLQLEISQLEKEKALVELEVENYRQGQEARTEALREEEQKREAILAAGGDLSRELVNFAFEADTMRREAALEELRVQKEAELTLVEDNEQAKAFVEEKYRQKELQLKRQQAQADKEKALFEATIAGFRAVVQALPNIPLSVLVGAMAALNVGKIAARPLPKYRDGVIALDGPGTETRDSIFARLSRGESVLTAATTKAYLPAIEAIHSGSIRPEVINRFIEQQGMSSTLLPKEITYQPLSDERIVKAIKEQTTKMKNERKEKTVVNIDQNGFQVYTEKQHTRTKFLNRRFKK